MGLGLDSPNAAGGTTEEDSRMLAFFDALVQRDLAGLSDDEDSDNDSTYTNTVYSSGDFSSADEGSICATT